MSDTLSDLASWLPAEFLSGDMDDKPLFLNHRLPYDFVSSSSTESESDDDDDIAGLTRRFTRSVSLQERLKIPYLVEKKRVFSGSPESTLNWNVSGHTRVRSSPTTPFFPPDEDAWDLIYAAGLQIARMKANNVNGGGFADRGLLGAPRPLGPNFSHHHRNCAIWNSENEVLIRQQQFLERFAGGGNYGGGGRFAAGRPLGVGQSAWPPHPVETQRRQQTAEAFAVKPVLSGPTGGGGRGNAVVKKGCAGTGVFLPRNYNNVQPELKKTPACSPAAHLQAIASQPFNKHLDHIAPQPQANIHGVFSRQHQVPQPYHILKCDDLAEKILVQRQNALMFLQQRRSGTVDVVPETRMGQAEVVLPQEWTY